MAKKVMTFNLTNSNPNNKDNGNRSTTTTTTAGNETQSAPHSSGSYDGGQWNFEGSVRYRGEPCPPGSLLFRVPPCSGPYPNYEIIIHGQDGKTIVSKLKTDLNGNYKGLLSPGTYVIYTRADIVPSNLKSIRFTIEPAKITKLSTLVVDTGNR